MTRSFLRASEVAERWGMSTGTLANWRVSGIGPTVTRIGNNIRYAIADIEAFESASRVEALA